MHCWALRGAPAGLGSGALQGAGDPRRRGHPDRFTALRVPGPADRTPVGVSTLQLWGHAPAASEPEALTPSPRGASLLSGRPPFHRSPARPPARSLTRSLTLHDPRSEAASAAQQPGPRADARAARSRAVRSRVGRQPLTCSTSARPSSEPATPDF